MKRVTTKNRKRIAEMRAVGVEWVMLLPMNLMDRCCSCAWKRANEYIPILDAPDLPLLGCSASKCMCRLIAMVKPKTK